MTYSFYFQNPVADDPLFFLLENGADPNVVNNEGYTLLHRVAKSNILHTATILLEYEATRIDAQTPVRKFH